MGTITLSEAIRLYYQELLTTRRHIKNTYQWPLVQETLLNTNLARIEALKTLASYVPEEFADIDWSQEL